MSNEAEQQEMRHGIKSWQVARNFREQLAAAQGLPAGLQQPLMPQAAFLRLPSSPRKGNQRRPRGR